MEHNLVKLNVSDVYCPSTTPVHVTHNLERGVTGSASTLVPSISLIRRR